MAAHVSETRKWDMGYSGCSRQSYKLPSPMWDPCGKWLNGQPVWSFISDLGLLTLVLMGDLGAELTSILALDVLQLRCVYTGPARGPKVKPGCLWHAEEPAL
jgi:hypothetical protein